MNLENSALILRGLRAANIVLSFLISLGFTLAVVLLAIGIPTGFREIGGVLGSALAIGGLILSIFTGFLVVRWQKGFMAGKGLKTNVILFLVLVGLFLVCGPAPFIFI
jgi:hypothetical protein